MIRDDVKNYLASLIVCRSHLDNLANHSSMCSDFTALWGNLRALYLISCMLAWLTAKLS